VTTAQPPEAPPCYRLRSVPGLGKLLALVMLYAMHDLHRVPRVQAFGSSGRLVKCAQESAGKRYGSSGKKLGTASLTWALSEAVGLVLRNHEAGQKYGARLEPNQGQGKALTILAQKLARAGYDMLKRDTAFDMDLFLHRYRRGGGEPGVSLDDSGGAGAQRFGRLNPLRHRTRISASAVDPGALGL